MQRIVVLLLGALAIDPAHGGNFSTGAERAVRFGVHEIALTGSGAVENPFDTPAAVRFVSPAGGTVTVQAFYDGGNTWRARVYVADAGRWTWRSACRSDRALDGKSGSFTAGPSNLRGMLRPHRTNPKAWMTDDGRWFANISDTAYLLFHEQRAPMWREYVRDVAAKGITSMRVGALGAWGGTLGAKVDNNNSWDWNDPWAGNAAPDYRRFDVHKFQNTEERLKWILENYPDLYIQLILFSFKGYATEATGNWWASLAPEARTAAMRYMIARWAAFPNLFWLIVNDMHCDAKFPANRAFAREVGNYFTANDPWHHPIASGPNRRAGYPFTGADDLSWSSYVYIEDADAVGADAIAKFGFDRIPRHVFMGEDYYEHDYGVYTDARYFFRWLFWSWLLSGGSANYGSRWGVIHPYSETHRADLHWVGPSKIDYAGRQLVGLDSVPYIRAYFEKRNIDLGRFEPDDALAADMDGRGGQLRPKLMHRGREEFLVYHPNPGPDRLPEGMPESGRTRAQGMVRTVDGERAARLRVDLSGAAGPMEVEWFRAYDGAAARGEAVEGGAPREFTAPWKGADVVLRLKRQEAAEERPGTVFRSGADGYHTYRIPALIATRKGTLLAFCEARRDSGSDTGNIDLVVKRSSDNGRTWSAAQPVADFGEDTVGNPAPVVDRRTGRILLLLTRNPGAATERQIIARTATGTRTVWIMRSGDDGITWSAPEEITAAVKRPEWTWYATGPGNGIQLRSGRLVVPCDHYGSEESDRHSHVIYSDDGGAAWKIGGVAARGTNESAVAELRDGSLLLNMRSYHGQNRRAVARSSDGGLTWSEVTLDEALVEPVCQASMVMARDGLVFSNPADARRDRMTVRLSRDGGRTWPFSRLLYEGPSAYSSLAVLKDGSIGLLYERGERSAYERIVFERFTTKWLSVR